MARVVVVSIHLVNTFGLVGCGALTAWWSQNQRAGGDSTTTWRLSLLWSVVSLGLLLLVGVTGAMTALADTLYPVRAGAASFQATGPVHWLVALRVLHPLLAVITAFFWWIFAMYLSAQRPHRPVMQLSRLMLLLIFAQIMAGVVTLVMGVPGTMQVFHLFLAQLVWIVALLLVISARSLRFSIPPA